MLTKEPWVPLVFTDSDWPMDCAQKGLFWVRQVETAVSPGLTLSSTATSETTCSRRHNLKMTRGLDPQVTAWRRAEQGRGPPDPH